MHNEIVPISGGAGISLSCHSPSYDDNTINLKHFGFLFIFFSRHSSSELFFSERTQCHVLGVFVFLIAFLIWPWGLIMSLPLSTYIHVTICTLYLSFYNLPVLRFEGSFPFVSLLYLI